MTDSNEDAERSDQDEQDEQAEQAGRAEHADSPVDSPWSRSAEEVGQALEVDPDQGLSEGEVKQRRERFGPNALREAEHRSIWEILYEQFESLVVVLLVGAAIAALAFGHFLDAAAIGVVLALNTIIGFVTEYRAVRSMEALREMGDIEARVVRGGSEERLHAREIVPGDVVLLQQGEVVPADMRVVEVQDIEVDESSLTGESVPVSKSPEAVDGQTPLAERSSILYRGTVVTRGSARAVVVSTGMATEIGEISVMVQEGDDERVPLEERLDKLGRRLVWVVIVVVLLMGVVGFVAGRDLLLMVETSIALAVAAVPEGLPIVATVALSYGMWQMKKHNALVRNLPSVETLGAATVICSDKTGTLTENEMTVEALALAGGQGSRLAVERGGEGDDGRAELVSDGGEAAETGAKGADLEENERLRRAVQVAVLANDVGGPGDADGEEAGGKADDGTDDEPDEEVGPEDPMEVALLQLGEHLGRPRESLIDEHPEVRREPFDTDINMMATVHEAGGEGGEGGESAGKFVAVKGAPESVVEHSTSIFGESDSGNLDDATRDELREQADAMAEEGYRVLGLATRRVDDADGDLYEELEFLGFIGLLDPPREDVCEALERCHHAGVRTVMITGDHPATARNIAEEIGLIQDERAEPLTGEDLDRLAEQSAEERRGELLDTEVLARVNPEQKLELIDMLQEDGQVVAMTGDGVNDAPALQSADIGVAMGERGTEVAKEAADMILLDDAYSTIVEAVRQGRVIFENIRKFAVYLLSGNIGEIALVGTAAVFGAALPLLPLQILYLNVLNDVFPALALGVGPGDEQIMERRPRKTDTSIMEGRDWQDTAFFGLLIAAAVGVGFALAMGPIGWSTEKAVTVSFLSVSISRLLHVFNMRDPESGLFSNGISRNVWVWAALGLDVALLLVAVYWSPLAEILSLIPPGGIGWLVVAAISVVPLILGQIYLAIRGGRREARRDEEELSWLQRQTGGAGDEAPA